MGKKEWEKQNLKIKTRNKLILVQLQRLMSYCTSQENSPGVRKAILGIVRWNLPPNVTYSEFCEKKGLRK